VPVVRHVLFLFETPHLNKLLRYRTINQILELELPFSRQVIQWFLSLSQEIAVQAGKDDIFNIIEIRQNGKLMITIRLIDLKTWVNLQEKSVETFHFLNQKQNELREEGLISVTLWEDTWIKEQTIVKSRLCAMLGISYRIPARATVVRRIDKPTADKFLYRNHLQHAVTSKFKYGLFLPNRYFRLLNSDYQIDRNDPEILVAVATFSAPRIFNRHGQPFRSYELIRFASLLDTTVVGGLDKLLRFFTHECRPDDIMTYADLEWSDGASYKRLGFLPVSDKAPMKMWLNTETYQRFSKPENTPDSKIIEVYNAGSRKFVKEILASFTALSL